MLRFSAGWFFERRVDPVGLNGFAYGLGAVCTRQRGKPAAQRRPALRFRCLGPR